MTHRSVMKPIPAMTQRSNETAGLTLMTDVSENTPMTDDTFSPVDPHHARAQRGETTAKPRSVIAPTAKHFDHTLTEPAQLTHCTRCAAPVIRAHTDGLLTTCDPTPLTLTDQIRAHLDGRHTVGILSRANGTAELIHRCTTRIRVNADHTVIATHQCFGPPLTTKQIRALPPPTLLLTGRQLDTHAGDTPPF